MKRMDSAVPMLFPYEPDEFWQKVRLIVHEEVKQAEKSKLQEEELMITPGLSQKPLYKVAEICQLFRVSRTTVHDWVKHGKLRPVKIGSRVYFLGNEVKQLLEQV